MYTFQEQLACLVMWGTVWGNEGNEKRILFCSAWCVISQIVLDFTGNAFRLRGWECQGEVQRDRKAPAEDQMGLCWGQGMGRERRVASSVPAPPNTSLTTLPHPPVPEFFTPQLMTKPTLPSARKNTWRELSLFLAEWVLRKLLNLFDSFLHFLKCCGMWKIGTLIPASLALVWDKVLVSDTNEGIPIVTCPLPPVFPEGDGAWL